MPRDEAIAMFAEFDSFLHPDLRAEMIYSIAQQRQQHHRHPVGLSPATTQRFSATPTGTIPEGTI